MRYRYDPEDLRPLHPISDEDFRECIRVMRLCMRQNNEEYEREHPKEPVKLRYLY
jgi:hypothetical protein